MAAVDGSKPVGNVDLPVEFLLFRRIGLGGFHQVLIDKIFEARQGPQSVLPAKLIETWDAPFPVADDVEGRDVDLVARLIDMQILKELRMIEQGQPSQSL